MSATRPGYLGTVVTPDGVVVYGTGVVYTPWVGTVWYPPPPTYGAGAGFAWGATTGFIMGAATGAAMWRPSAPMLDGSYNTNVNVNKTHLQLQRLATCTTAGARPPCRTATRARRCIRARTTQGRDEQPEQQRLCVARRQRLQETGRDLGEVGRRRQRLAAREHQYDELERSEPGRPEAGDPAVHRATAEQPAAGHQATECATASHPAAGRPKRSAGDGSASARIGPAGRRAGGLGAGARRPARVRAERAGRASASGSAARSSSGGGFQGFGGRAAGGMQGLEGESEARDRGFQRFRGFRGGGFRR